MSAPALAGEAATGTVVIGADDGTVYGLDPASGDARWTYPIGGAVEAPVIVANGRAYAASHSGAVVALDPNDGTPAFTCTLNGSAFDCPDRLTNTQDLRPAVDAVFTARAVARGTFSTSTRASGRQEATVTCAGTQCNATGASFQAARKHRAGPLRAPVK